MTNEPPRVEGPFYRGLFFGALVLALPFWALIIYAFLRWG